jgi:hypothetical protein
MWRADDAMSEYSKGRQSSRRLLGQPSGQWSLLEEDMAAAAAGQLDLAKPSTPLYIRELKEQVKVGLLVAAGRVVPAAVPSIHAWMR